MNKTKLIVPKGIRYISDWSDYSLEHYQFPHILNKTLTGCGFTEYCITNHLNVILCSPRRILLQNKTDQHQGDVYYVRNEIESQTCFEKDFTGVNATKAKSTPITDLGFSDDEKRARILQLKDGIKYYWKSCQPSPFSSGKPCKILVTYDSFRHVKEALGEDIKNFYIVIDEFQSIFTDAKFKSNTELEFVNHLQGLSRVCLISATPMLEKYLDMLDEFKNLPYFELDWVSEDQSRLIKPNLNVKYCGKKNTIQANIKKVIQTYINGNFERYCYKDSSGLLQQIESKEAVIYVNSVKDITKAIKGSNLTIDQCNILCSDMKENEKQIRQAFNGKARDGIKYIGTVPKYGEKHKMFTFCTRTVYLGADFYSDNARTFIFSNANIDSLSVDISMDLPQILGRQRLDINPWKNSADLYVTLMYDPSEKAKQERVNILKIKEEKTNKLLTAYGEVSIGNKDILAEKYEKDARNSNYKDDYVAVNHHSGSRPTPVFNNLMRISELRTFEIQEYDYKDRFSVFSRLSGGYDIQSSKDRIEATINNFNFSYTMWEDRMRYLCSQKSILSEEEYNTVLNLIPIEFKNYLTVFDVSKIGTCKYRQADLKKEFDRLYGSQVAESKLQDIILSLFKVGGKYTKAEIKEKLRKIYLSIGYSFTPKATDLEQWFEIKEIQWRENGKKIAGFEIIKKRGD